MLQEWRSNIEMVPSTSAGRNIIDPMRMTSRPGLGLGFRVWGLGFRVWGLGFREACLEGPGGVVIRLIRGDN